MKSFLTAALIVVAACSTQAHADCKAEVDQAFTKLRGGKGFRVENKIVDERQGSLTQTIEYQLPDRMHQSVSMGDSPQSMELIVIGNKAWSNQGQGWTEVPANFAEVMVKQVKESVAEPSKSQLEYECVGDTTFEGKTYLGYRAKLPAEEKVKGDDKVVPGKIHSVYIDKETGLPARTVVTLDDGSDKRLFDGKFSQPDITINEPAG